MNELLRQEILQVISLIPYGKVATYGQIARLSGAARHSRYVGFVLKNLASDSNIAWYRVINAQAKISLKKEDAQGQNIQMAKLQAEGVVVVSGKINLKVFQWQPDE